MRPALTLRGRGLLSAGVSVLACGLLLGQPDLTRLAVFVLTLPLASVLLHLLRPTHLGVERTIRADHVTAGEETDVRLALRNNGRSGAGPLHVEESLPAELGYSPRYTVGSLPPDASSAVTYRVRCDTRGKWTLGPVRVVRVDPLGLVEWRTTLARTDHVVVSPRVHPLSGVLTGGAASGLGETSAGVTAAAGEHDMSVREYRHGDDLRRVHWRATARHGELMVRTDEQPLHHHTTLLLDARFVAHRGSGAHGSFEWAVSAAASAGVHLPNAGFRVTMLTTGETGWIDLDDAREQLDLLAVLPLSGERNLPTSGVDEHDAGQLVAILGELSADDARALRELGRTAAAKAAVLLRTEAFDPHVDGARIARRRAESASALAESGWRVVEAGPDTAIGSAWAQAVHRDPVGVARGF